MATVYTYRFIKESNGNVIIQWLRNGQPFQRFSVQPAKDIRMSLTANGQVVIPIDNNGGIDGQDSIAVPFDRIDFVNSVPSSANPSSPNDAVQRLGEDFFYESVGGGGGVQSVTGSLVDNTDPANPVINLQDLSGLQEKSIVVASNITAVNDGNYTNVASATYTDPSPVEGKGFKVMVRNGTATVGGVGYSTAGTVILRIFHSGSWANYVYQVAGGGVSNLADFDSTPIVITGTTANTLVRTVAIPTNIGNCGLRITSLMRMITQVSGSNINRVSIGTSLGSSTLIAQGQLVTVFSSVIQGTFSIVGGASGSIKYMPSANLPFDFIVNRNTTVTNIDFTVQQFLFFSVVPGNVGNVLEVYGTSVEKF